MPGPRPSALTFDADLTLTVTTPGGRSTSARAVGEGSGLRITSPRPDILLAALSRDVIGPVADALHAADVSVFVDGPRGQVAVIGAAAGTGRLGRLVTGSSHSAVRPSQVVAAWVAPAFAVVAAVSVAAAILRSRRR